VRRDSTALPRANAPKDAGIAAEIEAQSGVRTIELGTIGGRVFAWLGDVVRPVAKIGAQLSSNQDAISETSHSRKFPRLKPRLNGNFSLGPFKATLKIHDT
jgi:hypothetical protein